MCQQILLERARVEIAGDPEEVQAFFEPGLGLEPDGAQVVKLNEHLESRFLHPIRKVKVLPCHFATELLAIVLFLLEHRVLEVLILLHDDLVAVNLVPSQNEDHVAPLFFEGSVHLREGVIARHRLTHDCLLQEAVGVLFFGNELLDLSGVILDVLARFDTLIVDGQQKQSDIA